VRIGQGYAAAQFQAGEKIILAGEVIPCAQSLQLPADGDVLSLALCDALLGAAALGDMHKHFPRSDAQYKHADSRALLRLVGATLKSRRFKLSNIDATLFVRIPNVARHFEGMCANIADDLRVTSAQVNVKLAKFGPSEFAGGEGIAAMCVVLLHE